MQGEIWIGMWERGCDRFQRQQREFVLTGSPQPTYRRGEAEARGSLGREMGSPMGWNREKKKLCTKNKRARCVFRRALSHGRLVTSSQEQVEKRVRSDRGRDFWGKKGAFLLKKTRCHQQSRHRAAESHGPASTDSGDSLVPAACFEAGVGMRHAASWAFLCHHTSSWFMQDLARPMLVLSSIKIKWVPYSINKRFPSDLLVLRERHRGWRALPGPAGLCRSRLQQTLLLVLWGRTEPVLHPPR